MGKAKQDLKKAEDKLAKLKKKHRELGWWGRLMKVPVYLWNGVKWTGRTLMWWRG